MSVRKLALFLFTAAVLGSALFAWFRPYDQTAIQAEVQKLVQEYDDAIYLDADYESAKNAANEILSLCDKSNDSRALKVRGLMRLAYLEIVSGKWGNNWGKNIKTCQATVTQEPTIDRAEFLLYLGSIRGKWQGKFGEGLEKIQESLWVASHVKDDRTLALAYAKLSELHMFLNQPNLVARNAYRGLTVAKSIGRKSINAVTLRNLVDDLVYLNKIPEAAEVGKQLLKLKPNSVEAMFVLFANGDSDLLEKHVETRIKEVQEIEDDGGLLSNIEAAKFGKLLIRSAMGNLHRNEFSKCRKRTNIAIPYLESAGDNTSLNSCRKLLNVAKLELADDVDKVDKIAAEFSKDDDLPNKFLAVAYEKAGDLEKSVYWKQRFLDQKVKREGSEIGFLRQSSEMYWQSELRIRKQAALNTKMVAKSTRRVWVLSTLLVLGSTVCGLLGCFYYLLRRERNLLEKTVDVRTRSLSEAMKKASAADQAKSDFLAQINHEIRNPLTAILSYCELLSSNNERSLEFVSGIESSSNHLRTLVDEILEVSKFETSGFEIEPIKFSPQQTANDINGIMFEQAIRKGLNLRCSFVGDPELSVVSDETKIRQLALNLIGNAIKFTESGTVSVSFELKQSDNSTNADLIITVQDTGIGIPENETRTVFDRFTKATNGTTREGSGLGLFIVSQLVDCLNGEIAIDSKLGMGTTAIVALPVKVAGGQTVNSQGVIDPGKNGSTAPSFNSAKRILVVDDQEMIRISLKLQLEASGVECEATEELEQIIELVENWHPHLVLLDLRMPVYSGYEVLEKIRQSNNPSLPIYAITGDATAAVKQKCLSSGFNGFITKPFKIAVILEVLESHSENTTAAVSPR